MAAFQCVICSEALSTPPPDYDEEDAVAEKATAAALAADSSRRLSILEESFRSGPKRSGVKAASKLVKKKPLTESAITANNCGHLFHTICLGRWFEKNHPKKCPACRRMCYISNLIPLYPMLMEPGKEETIGAYGGPPPPMNSSAAEELAELKLIHGTLISDHEAKEKELQKAHDKITFLHTKINTLKTMAHENKGEMERLALQMEGCEIGPLDGNATAEAASSKEAPKTAKEKVDIWQGRRKSVRLALKEEENKVGAGAKAKKGNR